jgi:hypothetical protein
MKTSYFYDTHFILSGWLYDTRLVCIEDMKEILSSSFEIRKRKTNSLPRRTRADKAEF